MSIESHVRKIDDLRLAQFESFSVSSISEAKQALAKIRDIQKQLRQIKREINVDMKAIRVAFAEKKSTAGSGGSAVLAVFGKRKLAGSYRAGAKRQLNKERDQMLAPYESLKLAIDKAIIDFDQMKMQLSTYLEEAKRDIQPVFAIKPSQTVCPKCGNPIENDDRFCRKCGNELSSTSDLLPPPEIYPPGVLGGN